VEYKTTLRNARKKCNPKCVSIESYSLLRPIDRQESIIGTAYRWPKNYLLGSYFPDTADHQGTKAHQARLQHAEQNYFFKINFR
jgi:hypothetical protein